LHQGAGILISGGLKHTIPVVLATVVMCVGLMSGCTSTASAWSASATSTPCYAYVGDTVSFGVDFINTGGNNIYVFKASLIVDWGANNTTYGIGYFTYNWPGEGGPYPCSFTVPDVPPGTYNMSIRILGQGDGEESAEDRIFPISPLTVMEIPNLTVNATSSGTSGQAPFTASMSAVTDGGVGPFTYTWDFGDGHTGFSSSPSCNYTYSTNGNYTATCWVSDSKGQTANDSITFNVTSSLGNDVSGWIGPLIIVGIIAVIVAVIAVKFVVARKK